MSRPHPRFEEDRVRALLAGDAEAKEEFFDHFYDRVYGYVLQTVRNRERAEDLTHEAFLRIHRALDRLEPGLDPAPWVFTVAANVVRDDFRRRQRQAAAVDLDELWDEPEAPQTRADETLVAREEDRRVHRALEQLSAADRELIALRAWEELSVEELATVLRSNAVAIRQRWSRALKRLGKAYESVGAERAGER